MAASRSCTVSPVSGDHLAKPAPRFAPCVRLSCRISASSWNSSATGVAETCSSTATPAPTAVGKFPAAESGEVPAWPARATTASYTNVNDSSMRACTCTVAPPGCRVSVVTSRAPSPGTARCSNAVSLASGRTCAAAAFTNAPRSATPFGAYSHTWRPSGVATWLPGIITELSPVNFASSQCGLRRKRVGGMLANSSPANRRGNSVRKSRS